MHQGKNMERVKTRKERKMTKSLVLLMMAITLGGQSSHAAIKCLFEKTARSPRHLVTLNDNKTTSTQTQSGGYVEGRWMKESKNPTLAAQIQKTFPARMMNKQEQADFQYLVSGIAKTGYIVSQEGDAPHFMVATAKKSVKLSLKTGAVAQGRCQVLKKQ